ncbi:unnamed protein product, partial [Oppiella nova]
MRCQNPNKKHNDFIQLLMDTEAINTGEGMDEDRGLNTNTHHDNEGEEESEIRKKVFDIKLANKRLTEDEIVAQAFVFLLAGYLSTTGALANCLYELAVNPDVQQRLYDEINGAVDSDTGHIEYDRLARLPYLDAVMAETLRHHSLALPLSRYPTRDYQLGTTGITIKAGQQVEIPIYAIHHSEQYYPDPFKFKPD